MKQERNRGRPARRSRNKKEQRKRAAQALAAGAVIAGGTQAYAVPVRFDNAPGPGHFNWAAGATFLDITMDVAGQASARLGPSSFYHEPSANGYVSGRSQGPEVQLVWPVLVSFNSGELIGGSGDWANYAFADYSAYGYPGQLPEGQVAYLGGRFDLGAGFQYGWIGVVMTNLGGGPPTNTIELDAFAWGYETEVGTAIPAGAPEPGTLAVLAFGAAALLGPRRRRPAV